MLRTLAMTALAGGALGLAIAGHGAIQARPLAQNPTPTLVPPVATPTSAASPTPQLPPPVDTPTSVPQPAPGAEICPHMNGLVPAAVLNDALANPRQIGGFERARNPNKPVSPLNPVRRYLSLRNPNVPYHPIFNRPTWVAGCPWSAGRGARPPR